MIQGKIGSGVDAEPLDGGILDIEVRDGGLLHRMRVEELGLSLATVRALAIPPLCAVAIDDMPRGAVHGDLSTRDGDQGALPLLVAKGSSTLEGDSRASVQLGQVERGTSRDGDVVEDDVCAGSLVLGDICGTGRARKGAATGAILQIGCWGGRNKSAGAEKESGKMSGDHLDKKCRVNQKVDF